MANITVRAEISREVQETPSRIAAIFFYAQIPVAKLLQDDEFVRRLDWRTSITCRVALVLFTKFRPNISNLALTAMMVAEELLRTTHATRG